MTETSPSKQKICIVFYHGNDWDGVRARQRYLMQALSERFRIIYLDGTWSRRGWITVRRPEPGITVVAGFVSLLTALERRSLGWLGRLVGRLFSIFFRQPGETVVFWNAENSACPFRFIPHDRLVFDCIDPSFSEESAEIAAFHERDSKILRAADLVFASASSLVEHYRQENPDVHLLNNACEPAEYAAELVESSPHPQWWPTANRPIAAYLGTLDWRFDFALITAVAQQTPELTFILAGNVIPQCKSAVERLRALPNVICPGRISVEHGRHLIANCSVGIIPFRPGAMNDAVNPVKLYAYALLGKPVVGTPIRELFERPEAALIGRSPEQFVDHLASVVKGDAATPAPEALRAFALANTWKDRAAAVVAVFQEHGWTAKNEGSAPRSSFLGRVINRLRLDQRVRNVGNRYGRSYWRLPSILRRRLCWEASVPGLRGATTWRCAPGENVKRLDAIGAIRNPAFGHLLAAHPFRTADAFVSRLDEAWLVGKFASPVTLDGRLILSAFRDEPRMLGLERHPDLESWLEASPRPTSDLPALENIWPMVNRLQTNYFHWMIEWCGRLELIEVYRNQTGCAPRLLIPEPAPSYIRESLTLLGFGPENQISWAEDSAPRKVRNLVLPSFRGTTVAPSPAALAWLRRRFMAAAGVSPGAPRRIIYISRPRGGWRSVLNDEEVADWFCKEGHDVVQPHRLPLSEQIRRFSEASLIVGLHGAGLTNILFAPEATLLELTGAYGDALYFGMTARLGQPYDALPCQPVGDDVVVDLEALKKRVASLSQPGTFAHA